jgi:small subunit ribosomal protein S21
MLIVKLQEGENIERALKRFKRKFNQTKMNQQLREREQFTKPSVKKRQTKLKAKYIQKLRDEENKDQ